MIKHIVFWTLAETAEGASASENAEQIKRRLEGLNGRIGGLRHLEVGLDISKADASADVALYSEFDDEAALDAYQNHREHLAIAEFIGRVRTSRAVVDYEA